MKFISHKRKATLGVSVKLRNDYADYDYLDKLNPKELKWLKVFHREFINADFQHKYKKLISNRKEVYKLNNQKNRDLYNMKKWTNRLFLCYNVENEVVRHHYGLEERLLNLMLDKKRKDEV